MELLHDLDRIVEKEIRSIVDKGSVSPNEWENLKNAVCIMEKSKKVQHMALEDSIMDPTSKYSYDTRYLIERFPNGAPIDGRRMRDDHRDAYRGKYRYSSHSIRDRAIDKLEKMYDEADTDHERLVLDEMIAHIRST